MAATARDDPATARNDPALTLFKTARPKKLLCARTSPFLQSDRKAFEDLTVGHAERELLYPVPTSATTQAARKATPTFPIVMIIGSDVVREGVVANLAKPGGKPMGRLHVAVAGMLPIGNGFVPRYGLRSGAKRLIGDRGEGASSGRSSSRPEP
jgi:hypothetical protein